MRRNAEFACGECGTELRLAGYWWPVLLPSAIVLVFPFDAFASTATMLLALVASIVTVTCLAAALFVRVQAKPSHDSA
jgi:hypothetical protein